VGLEKVYWIAGYCNFYLTRLWRSQPLAFGLALCTFACAAAAATAWGYSASRAHAAQDALRHVVQHPPVATPVALPPVAGAELPVFDSASFAAEFLTTAREAGVPTEEVAYTLENGPTQPYMRYRIALETKAGYLEVRKFIAALSSAQPNVALDTIRCRRDDAGAAVLGCQLAFSAFFRKAGHG